MSSPSSSLTSDQIRDRFIRFFERHQHTIVKASPVVPQHDPTLLFTNAGMNQFKDVFLGQGKRDYTRAVNSQVCVRVSGKHNDLEDVGLDTTHLTSFEMLGNWSFGDYYKAESIQWAWELLTQEFGLPGDKLYATVYKTDDDSAALWKKVTTINPDHVLFFGEKDNFWEMGEVGPCGPCSELHLDRGPEACDKPHLDHVCEVNGVCARYIELWNLVFIQFNRQPDGSLIELPEKHVDTGAGLERLVAVLQGTHSNYNTDLFTPIIQEIEKLTGKPYQEGPEGMPHRVLADHVRTISFGIADNVMPSNEGRGYVLRRLLRRALRYATKLGIQDPIVYRLVAPMVARLGHHFTSLKDRQAFIESVIHAEEIQFLKTLHAGVKLFEEVAQKVTSSHQTIISGEDAFKLYDTFGFPLDLTQVMAREQGLSVALSAFDQALNTQKTRSREAHKQSQKKSQQEVQFAQDTSAEALEMSSRLLSPTPPKIVPMGGEVRIVSTPSDRVGMARHHTGTHLLQAALREALGEHVHQAGSLVDVDRLRFDFTHFQAVSAEELSKIEARVNDVINANLPIETYETDLETAKSQGAMALFGEKYDDVVRVVKISEFSMELCVGTHVGKTQDIQRVKILAEAAIAAGTRRIEALAGTHNVQLYLDKVKAEQVASEAQRLAKEETQRQKEEKATKIAHELSGKMTESQTLIDLISDDDLDGGSGRLILEEVAKEFPQSTVVLGIVAQGKGYLAVRVGNPNLGHNAALMIKTMTQITGGGGGGKANFAQAGGADPTKLTQALEAVRTTL